MKASFVRHAVGAASLFALAGTSVAGTLFGTLPNQNVFGSSYNIEIYRVATDLSSQGLTPPAGRVEPEGMTFYNGTLYVASDGAAAEANGYLAAYAGGNLGAAPTGQRFTVTSGANSAAYGPEGLTVNTRGSGFGSFAPGGAARFVAIDSVIAPVSQRILGAMNTGNGQVEDGIASTTFNYDDIAYVPGASAAQDRFAVIDASGAPVVRFLTTDSSPTLVGGSFALPTNSKGMVFLPAADAALFSSLATGDSLLISTGGVNISGVLFNRLSLYSLDGALIATSTIDAATGSVGFGEIEALAFDSATRRLFLGYENGASSQIGVFTVPTPGAAGVLGLAGLVLARRRRA